jgi:hypothetical protein
MSNKTSIKKRTIMGTNYYLKRIPTKEEIAQCHKLLDERKIEYDDVYKEEEYGAPYLEAVLEKITEKIHIGKKSLGWRFLFQIHRDLYGKSIQSCLDFLEKQTETGLWRFIDEYGEDIHLVDFESLVRNSLDQMTIEDYYEKYPEERRSEYYAPPQEVVEDGSRWWDVDFS